MFTVVLFDAQNYLLREFSGEEFYDAFMQAAPLWNNWKDNGEYMRMEVYENKKLVTVFTTTSGALNVTKGIYEKYYME